MFAPDVANVSLLRRNCGAHHVSSSDLSGASFAMVGITALRRRARPRGTMDISWICLEPVFGSALEVAVAADLGGTAVRRRARILGASFRLGAVKILVSRARLASCHHACRVLRASWFGPLRHVAPGENEVSTCGGASSHHTHTMGSKTRLISGPLAIGAMDHSVYLGDCVCCIIGWHGSAVDLVQSLIHSGVWNSVLAGHHLTALRWLAHQVLRAHITVLGRVGFHASTTAIGGRARAARAFVDTINHCERVSGDGSKQRERHKDLQPHHRYRR